MKNKSKLFIYKLIVCYTEQPIIGTICADSAADCIERLEDEYGRGSIESYGIRPLNDNLLDFTMDYPVTMDAKGQKVDFTFNPDDIDYGYSEFDEDELDEEGEPQVYQIQCPNCGRTLYFDSIDVKQRHHLRCPQCNCFIKEIELTDEEFNEDEDNDENNEERKD